MNILCYGNTLMFINIYLLYVSPLCVMYTWFCRLLLIEKKKKCLLLINPFSTRCDTHCQVYVQMFMSCLLNLLFYFYCMYNYFYLNLLHVTIIVTWHQTDLSLIPLPEKGKGNNVIIKLFGMGSLHGSSYNLYLKK